MSSETGQCRVWLRRYRSPRRDAPACPSAAGYHQARAFLYDEPVEKVGRDDGFHWSNPNERDWEKRFPATDPRWPQRCECGYAFDDLDERQYFWTPLYTNRNGEAVPKDQLEPGAMFESWWYPDGWKRDGRAITVVLPDGTDWNIDGPASGGGRWTREGEAPYITANPSIFSSPPDGYHGFLRNGWLERV